MDHGPYSYKAIGLPLSHLWKQRSSPLPFSPLPPAPTTYRVKPGHDPLQDGYATPGQCNRCNYIGLQRPPAAFGLGGGYCRDTIFPL